MRTDILFGNVKTESIIGELPENTEGVTDKSGEVKKGYCFFAVKGEKTDGREYVSEAVANGAETVVSEEAINDLPKGICNVIVKDIRVSMDEICKTFFVGENPKIKIIGVVGTNGKTSICHILYEILRYAGKKAAYIGTIGCRIGDDEETESLLTTPGTVELYKFIGKAEKSGAEYLAMELSAHAIAQKRGCGLYYECLIFTNCTEDHLDYFKDMETYSAVKKSVFCRGKCRYMVVNSDDKTGREILAANDLGSAVSYGIYNPADVFAIDINESKNGVFFIINLFDIIYDIKSPLIGLCNVYNLLASLACLALMGLKIHTLGGAVKKIGAIKGRAEKIAEVNGADIFLDYAHTPDGLKTTLNSMRKICECKLYCLFGCGGNREKEKRSVMGEISGVISDFTIITSDNPRYEDPCLIISEIERGIRRVTRNYITITDRHSALIYAVSLLKEGDVLVVAGKGAETYQEIMGIRRDFSDADEILSAVKIVSGERKQ